MASLIAVPVPQRPAAPEGDPFALGIGLTILRAQILRVNNRYIRKIRHAADMDIVALLSGTGFLSTGSALASGPLHPVFKQVDRRPRCTISETYRRGIPLAAIVHVQRCDQLFNGGA